MEEEASRLALGKIFIEATLIQGINNSDTSSKKRVYLKKLYAYILPFV